MWVAKADRHALVEVLGSRGRSEGLRIEAVDIQVAEYGDIESFGLDGEEVILVWPSDLTPQTTPPKLVVGSTEGVRNVLAWATTYFPDRSPLTSLLRICDIETLRFVALRERRPQFSSLEGACVGAVLGEVLTLAEGRLEPGQISPRACWSTYSFAAARLLALGAEKGALQHLTRRWALSREILGQRTRALTRDSLQEVWHVLYRVAEGASGQDSEDESVLMAESCRSIMLNGSLKSDQWRALLRGGPTIPDPADRMKVGPREERLQLAEQICDSFAAAGGRSAVVRSFLCGYLMSLVAPGELLFAPSLFKVISMAPTAVVWYGVCSGLTDGSNNVKVANGLGWRVLRDLLLEEALLGTPRGDISLDELLIYGNNLALRRKFYIYGWKSLTVEVFPRVYIAAATVQIGDVEQRSLFGGSDELATRGKGLKGTQKRPPKATRLKKEDYSAS